MSTTAKTPRKRAPRAAGTPAPKTAAPVKRPAARRAAAPGKPGARATTAPAGAPAAAAKPEKRKLVRDSFTIPADEYDLIGQLKKRAMALGREAKKSELLRAGLKALQDMADRALSATLAALPAVKTGRPKAKKAAEPKKAVQAKRPPKAAKPAKAAKTPKAAKPPKAAKRRTARAAAPAAPTSAR